MKVLIIKYLYSQPVGKHIFAFILMCFFQSIMLSGGYGQNIGFFFEKDQKKVSIPFKLHNNLISIPVIVNGEYVLNFILDTGIRHTMLIHKEIADAIGCEYTGNVELIGIGNSRPLNALVTQQISVSMPGIKSEGLSVLVLENNFLNLEHHLGTRIHGIIGYDVFGRFVVKINYAKNKIELFEPLDYKIKKKYQPIDLEVVESKPFTRIQLKVSDPVFSAKLLVDTGASHALILNTNSSEEIQLPATFIEASLGSGLAGEIQGKLGRIEEVKLGDKLLKDVIASYPNDSTFLNNYNFKSNGSIGGELLKKFTVIFDFYRSKMYLKPNGSFKFPFEYNMSGLELFAEGEALNKFIINKIRKNSPADNVGFEVGDIVVSLNNTPSSKLTLTKIYTALNQKEGKRINMSVLRNGTYISHSFLLKREI